MSENLMEFILMRVSERELAARLADDDTEVTRCETERRIVDLHSAIAGGRCASCAARGAVTRFVPMHEPWPCPTLRVMGEAYSGHLNYRDQWRPMFELLEGL